MYRYPWLLVARFIPLKRCFSLRCVKIFSQEDAVPWNEVSPSDSERDRHYQSIKWLITK